MVQAAAGFYTYVVVMSNYGFPANQLPGTAMWYTKDYDVTIDSATPPAWMQACKVSDPEDCARQTLKECVFQDGRTSDVCWDHMKALNHAQCAFFIAIIVVQWADLVICKTRTLSIMQQGMGNGTLNFGLLFTTILGSALCYIPGLNKVLGTAPLEFLHWCPAMPFCIFIFLYDEIRKSLMRKAPGGWVEKNTLY